MKLFLGTYVDMSVGRKFYWFAAVLECATCTIWDSTARFCDSYLENMASPPRPCDKIVLWFLKFKFQTISWFDFGE